MTDDEIGLSRRKVLGSLGAAGIGAVTLGAGTFALFNDTESFDNNTLAAGTLDLKVDWQEHYYNGLGDARRYVDYLGSGESVEGKQVGFPPNSANSIFAVHQDEVDEFMAATTVETSGPVDITGDTALIDLSDVKPGDYGEVTLSYHLLGNPGYVWLCANKAGEAENTINEPEGEDDTDDTGDLGDYIEVAIWYDPNCNNLKNGGEGIVVEQGTLNEVLENFGDDSCTLLDPAQTGGVSSGGFEDMCHTPGAGSGVACEETLYLVENVGNGRAGDGATPAGDGDSYLFEVELTSGKAVLTGESVLDGFENAHAAATPDGNHIYVIDRDPGELGVYNVSTGLFSTVGTIENYPGGVVLTAFSPDGTLYMASNDTDKLYTIESYETNPDAYLVGDTGIDVQGADMAFDINTLYLYSNATQSLYTVNPSTGAASLVGPTGEKLTGLAVRDAGTGPLIGSSTSDDEIIEIDRADGSVLARYPMMFEESDYKYDWGDMTVGELCTDRPSGHCVAFAWWLPPEVENVVQSDSYGFEIGFYAEQCRHNDNPAPNWTGQTALQ